MPKKRASQLVLKVEGRDLLRARIDGFDKQTELQVQTNNNSWIRVAEFDNNESSKLFFDLLAEHLVKPLHSARGLGFPSFPDFAKDFASSIGDSPGVREAKDKAAIARHRAEELRYRAEADRQAAKAGEAGGKPDEDESKVSGAVRKGCVAWLFLALVVPPLFVYLMMLAFRAGAS